MNQDTTQDRQALATRAVIYRFLARLFAKELDLLTVQNLKKPTTRAWLAEAGLILEDSWDQLDEQRLLESLAEEYCRLFIGPGPHLSPHESLHHQREDGDWGKYWGQDTVEVKALVDSLGLTYRQEFSAMPDHLSAEMELMASLAEAIAQRIETGDNQGATLLEDLERKFYTQHLGAWLPGYLVKLTELAQQGFYCQVAQLTQAFLETETDRTA